MRGILALPPPSEAVVAPPPPELHTVAGVADHGYFKLARSVIFVVKVSEDES